MTKRLASTGVGKSASFAGGWSEEPSMADHDGGDHPPMYWGPAGPPVNRELVDSWTPGTGDAWGSYHRVLFPSHEVTPWIRFKIMTSGANIAERLWDEREALRTEYQVAHGDDPDRWPARHPGVVLESVQWIAHAACLGCQWFDRNGTSMTVVNWRATAAEVARQHQVSAR